MNFDPTAGALVAIRYPGIFAFLRTIVFSASAAAQWQLGRDLLIDSVEDRIGGVGDKAFLSHPHAASHLGR